MFNMFVLKEWLENNQNMKWGGSICIKYQWPVSYPRRIWKSYWKPICWPFSNYLSDYRYRFNTYLYYRWIYGVIGNIIDIKNVRKLIKKIIIIESFHLLPIPTGVAWIDLLWPKWKVMGFMGGPNWSFFVKIILPDSRGGQLTF